MMKTEKVMVEFTQEELDDLIEELQNVLYLLSGAREEDIRELHKEEDENIQQMYLNLHRARVDVVDNTINKLVPHSNYYMQIVDEEIEIL